MARDIIGAAERARDLASNTASVVAAAAQDTASTVIGAGGRLLDHLPTLGDNNAYIRALEDQFDQTASAVARLPRRNHIAGVTPWRAVPSCSLGFEMHELTDQDSESFPIHRIRLGVQGTKTPNHQLTDWTPDTLIFAEHVAGLSNATDEGVRDREAAVRDGRSYWLGSFTLSRSELRTLKPEDAVSRLVTLNGLLVVYELSQQKMPDTD